MDYYNNDDEHDEDDLPEISMAHYTRKISSDDNDEQDDNHPNRTLENWRNLYETSINSLQSGEEDQRATTQKPSYLEPQISIEQPPIERPDSPIYEPPIDSNINKSKWEIRLPELLNSMVGPDRQKRDVSRRHTTNIVFQQIHDSSPFSLETDINQPINPLVKQLKQKFDGMTTTDGTKKHSETQKFHRVASLTCRGLTANTGERVVQRSRPVLPLRPTPEITPMKSRSGSIGPANNRMTNTTNRNNKPGPPISYPKHYYPPPSTTSVVKQLIGGGATLVYDSITQKSSSKTKPLIKHQKNLEQTREDLRNTNSPLTGRQLLPDYQKANKKNNGNNNNNHHPELLNSHEDESDENYYEPPVDQTLYNSSRRKSIETPAESWTRRRSTSTNERGNYYPIYDMDIKK